MCLDLLRARTTRREVYVPEPLISAPDRLDPEQEALLGDAVGLALLVVLETLNPAERLAFVLHDLFAVPFEEIAPIVARSPEAARQLASRARRRVQGAATVPDPDRRRQRDVVDAFRAASRHGDLNGLVAVLDPDAVLRADFGSGGTHHIHGGEHIARQALTFSRYAEFAQPALINGVAGVVTAWPGHVVSVMAFTVRDGRIAAIDVLADPDRLARLDLRRLTGLEEMSQEQQPEGTGDQEAHR